MFHREEALIYSLVLVGCFAAVYHGLISVIPAAIIVAYYTGYHVTRRILSEDGFHLRKQTTSDIRVLHRFYYDVEAGYSLDNEIPSWASFWIAGFWPLGIFVVMGLILANYLSTREMGILSGRRKYVKRDKSGNITQVMGFATATERRQLTEE